MFVPVFVPGFVFVFGLFWFGVVVGDVASFGAFDLSISIHDFLSELKMHTLSSSSVGADLHFSSIPLSFPLKINSKHFLSSFIQSPLLYTHFLVISFNGILAQAIGNLVESN